MTVLFAFTDDNYMYGRVRQLKRMIYAIFSRQRQKQNKNVKTRKIKHNYGENKNVKMAMQRLLFTIINRVEHVMHTILNV